MSDAKDKDQGPVTPEQLAAAHRAIAALERKLDRIVDAYAGLAAELYCAEINMGLREPHGIGIDGFRFGSASKSTWNQIRQQIKAAVVGE